MQEDEDDGTTHSRSAIHRDLAAPRGAQDAHVARIEAVSVLGHDRASSRTIARQRGQRTAGRVKPGGMRRRVLHPQRTTR